MGISAEAWDGIHRIAGVDRPFKRTDDRNVYDNRLEGERTGFQRFSAEYLDEYLTLKFFYFVRRLEAVFFDNVLCVEIARSLDEHPFVGEPIHADIASIWDEAFPEECKAYILRTLQCPRDVVIATWYNEIDTCVAWCNALDHLGATLSSTELKERLGSSFPLDLEGERRNYERLVELRQAIGHDFDQPLSGAAVASAFRTRHVEAILDKLLETLYTQLQDPALEFTICLQALLEVIADSYGIRICDYLGVTFRDEAARLMILASSHSAPVIDIRAGEYQYHPAAGITGSAFLLARDFTHRWLGTENLATDPRAGPEHKSAFERDAAYGSVTSFWVFPVFAGDQLTGVLRVVDVTEDGYISGLDGASGWPYQVRSELAHIADWLGAIVTVLGVTLDVDREDSIAATVAAVRREGAYIVDWVPTQFLSAVLSQLTKLALIRSEHRAIGCLVALTTQGARRELEARTHMPELDGISSDRSQGFLAHATDLFARVLPGAGLFVCPVPIVDSGASVPYVKVLATSRLDPTDVVDDLSQIPELCLVNVSGERALLRIYEAGRTVADYFLNEKSGTWQLRVFATCFDQVRALCTSERPIQENLLRVILQQIIDYSYEGFGGLFVISRGNIPSSLIADSGFRVDESVRDIDRRLFANIAAVDGGVSINSSTGQIREAGIIFNNEDVDDEVRRFVGGARHRAARAIWQKLPETMIVAVSANREITAFGAAPEPIKF